MMSQTATREELHDIIVACADGFQDELFEPGRTAAFVDRIIAHAELIVQRDAAGMLVGCVAYYCNDRTTLDAYVTLVAVRLEARGRGLARTMLEQCIARAGLSGFRRVGLRVLQRNRGAISLYLAMGFAVIDRGKDDFGMSVVLDQLHGGHDEAHH